MIDNMLLRVHNDPLEQLYLLPDIAAAPFAPTELLSLLLGSRCSTGAVRCAPLKTLL